MIKVKHQRQVFDRRAIDAALAALAPEDSAPAGSPAIRAPAVRAEVLAVLKEALAAGQAEVRNRIEHRATGHAIVAANTFLIDQLLRVLFDHASKRLFPEPNPTSAQRLALVALGGYGRGDMAPRSDIDLLFLHPWKLTARMEQVIESMLYLLWDLGLKVGQATRSLDDSIQRARGDMTIRTSVLEARFICGDQALFTELHDRFRTEIIPGSEAEFVKAKLDERDERHEKLGNSRYLLEPNIKDGKGGLRDLHTLFWIAKYLYRVEQFADLVDRGVLTGQEHARFARAENFLWRVRAHMHVAAGRAEDRLTFDLQPEIAARMGYGARDGNLAVERFMKHYFLVAKTVGQLTRVFCAALEAEQLHQPPGAGGGAGGAPASDGIRAESGRLTVESDAAFAERPVRLIKIFRLSQSGGLDINPHTHRLIQQDLRLIDKRVREDPEANQLFLDILTDERRPEATLRRMNEAGVLGRLIPEFGRVVAQTQHDMYHVYTVDEHTIRAIGVLSRIGRGEVADDLPLACELMPKVLSRRALYVATFLHDIAKGQRGDHSEIGARWALRLGPRFGLRQEETDTVSWLVRHHLLFSNTAFKRDIHDPQTLSDFVGQVQSVERLRLLLVLTAADIRAVGPGRWNAWKGTLLRELYHSAEEIMTGGHAATQRESRVEAAKRLLRDQLSDWLNDEFDAYAARHDAPYWLSVDVATQRRHALLVRDADRRQSGLALDTAVDAGRATAEITFYANDHAGLFASAAGALAAAGATILDAKVFTTSDGMALDAFQVQDASGAPFTDEERLARALGLLEQALAGELKLDKALMERRGPRARSTGIGVAPRVLVDNDASARHTVIEVTAKDRPGLLHDVARVLTNFGFSIVTAHISTYGERVVDVFYVKDRYGLKISDKRLVKRLRNGLLTAIDETSIGGDAEAAA